MADHREIEGLLDLLETSSPGSARNRAVAELASKLTLHMEIEESIVYPLVRDQIGDDTEEEADVEHELIRGQLDKLTLLLEAPGFAAAVGMLAGGLRHHFIVEERHILPALLSQLQPEERRALGDAVAVARSRADANAGLARPPDDLPRANAFCPSH